jgi:EAL domain-containing protein (putative c-di-GMP-specific phosphodiesterase class I)
MRALRQLNTRQSLTLEIHEAAVAKPALMKELRNELRQLNIGLAFDDFGAGQARLAELFEVVPDYLKFDMSLIRNIHEASAEQIEMVKSLVHMVRHMNIVPLAEGVESTAERDVCMELGFELAQGYLFGKPVPLHVN